MLINNSIVEYIRVYPVYQRIDEWIMKQYGDVSQSVIEMITGKNAGRTEVRLD